MLNVNRKNALRDIFYIYIYEIYFNTLNCTFGTALYSPSQVSMQALARGKSTAIVAPQCPTIGRFVWCLDLLLALVCPSSVGKQFYLRSRWHSAHTALCDALTYKSLSLCERVKVRGLRIQVSFHPNTPLGFKTAWIVSSDISLGARWAVRLGLTKGAGITDHATPFMTTISILTMATADRRT